MKRAIKNHNKENFLPLANRFNSQGKSARGEFVSKQSKKMQMQKKRSSLISLKLQQNDLPELLVRRKQENNKLRVITEGSTKSSAILDSITNILKFKEIKTIDLQIQKLQDLRNKNRVLRKDLLSLENVMLKYSMKNIKANQSEIQMIKRPRKKSTNLSIRQKKYV